jgi:hypothetical protein
MYKHNTIFAWNKKATVFRDAFDRQIAHSPKTDVLYLYKKDYELLQSIASKDCDKNNLVYKGREIKIYGNV